MKASASPRPPPGEIPTGVTNKETASKTKDAAPPSLPNSATGNDDSHPEIHNASSENAPEIPHLTSPPQPPPSASLSSPSSSQKSPPLTNSQSLPSLPSPQTPHHDNTSLDTAPNRKLESESENSHNPKPPPAPSAQGLAQVKGIPSKPPNQLTRPPSFTKTKSPKT